LRLKASISGEKTSSQRKVTTTFSVRGRVGDEFVLTDSEGNEQELFTPEEADKMIEEGKI
jgi:hypothetical protein